MACRTRLVRTRTSRYCRVYSTGGSSVARPVRLNVEMDGIAHTRMSSAKGMCSKAAACFELQSAVVMQSEGCGWAKQNRMTRLEAQLGYPPLGVLTGQL